ncbi:MAG: hypothetical protein Q9215_005350 [Flavoplaca cf. flavocitrina]
MSSESADAADYEELFKAATEGQIDRLRAALKPRLDVNSLQAIQTPSTIESQAVLHVAARHGKVEAIQYLLTHGADIHVQDSVAETPLHSAASAATIACVELLLSSGADVHYSSNGRYSRYLVKHPLRCLLDADTPITKQQIDIVTLFLDHGFDVNTPICSQLLGAQYLIERASQLGSLDLVRILVERGSHFHHVLSYGKPDYEMVTFLVDKGAKLNDAGGYSSPLAVSASGDDLRTLLFVLARLENTDIVNDGQALHCAVTSGHLEYIDQLINRGMDVDVVSPSTGGVQTPLMVGLSGHVAPANTVRKLLERGANIMRTDNFGNSALQSAAYPYNPELVQILLDAGAETATRNVYGDTSLITYAKMLFKEYSCFPNQTVEARLEAFNKILSNTVDVTARNDLGDTALHSLATARGSNVNRPGGIEAIKALVNKGVDVRAFNNDMKTAGDLFSEVETGPWAWREASLLNLLAGYDQK